MHNEVKNGKMEIIERNHQILTENKVVLTSSVKQLYKFIKYVENFCVIFQTRTLCNFFKRDNKGQ